MNEASFGEDMAVDHDAWTELLQRSLATTKNPSLIEDINQGLLTVADHSDNGSLDLAPEVAEGLAERGLTSEQIKRVLEIDPDVARALAEDPELAFPNDAIAKRVTEARLNEQTSEEAGLDPIYFPPGYDRDIEALREADGITKNQREIDRIRKKLGTDTEDENVREIEIVSNTADRLGAESWKGSWLARMTEEGKRSRSGPDNSLSDEAFDLIGDEINESPEASTSYFNRLGVETTAELPSYIAESPETVEKFSEALGTASKHRTPDGKRALEFSGDELIDAPVDRREYGVSPEVLFITGDFDDTFLADATEASIRKKETDGGSDLLEDWSPEGRSYPRDINQEISDSHTEGKRDELEERYGPDATNILLDRANENPEVVGRVFDELEDSDDLHLLLDPEDEYEPDNRPGHRGYPITEFLGIVGDDKERSKKVFIAASEVDEFSDPGVAGGVDAIMGKHSTVGYPDSYLELPDGFDIDYGERLSRTEWLELGLSSDDWKELQGKVLHHGQGGALVEGNKLLLQEAIESDLEADSDGRAVLDGDYTKFGYTIGLLEGKWVDRVLELDAELDGDNDRLNRFQSAMLSSTLALGGTVPVVGKFAGPLDVLLSYLGIMNTEHTDNEKDELRKQFEKERYNPPAQRWGEMAVIAAMRTAKEQGVPVTDKHGNTIRLTSGDKLMRETEWGWEQVDVNEVDWDDHDDHNNGAGVGDTQDAAESTIGNHENTGKRASNPGQEYHEARRAVRENGVWVELPEKGN